MGTVGTTAIMATNAFFTDTSVSANNTFQAGNLKLQVKSQCSYNGVTDAAGCGSFDWTNGTLSKFFNFGDIKPGDYGENTISFKVLTNDAWMCASLNAGTHEKLADYLQVFWWVDSNGDNLYQSGEKVLYNGAQPLSAYLAIHNPLYLTFADKLLNWETGVAGQPIPGNTEKHLGVGWCFGNLTLNTTSPGFTCDGSAVTNDPQGTKVVADLQFDISQYRNNPDFLCPEHQSR
jgi:predicted ribosomally synthesized peptide with SipW-like signal peptide